MTSTPTLSNTTETDEPKGLSFAPPAVDQEMLLQAFQGDFVPVQETWSYRIGLFLTASAMLLLPLIYIGIVALVGTTVGRFAWSWRSFLRGGIMGPLIYLSLLVAGLSLLVVMMRPFFSREQESETAEEIAPEDEPLLFAFVHQVCDLLHAPPPSRIEVDLDVNASASFQRGLGNFLQRKMTLRLGLPLIAGLNLRQLTGILAHEFGHFAQGTGMRLGYLVRRINRWFLRVVYERTAFDFKLEELSQSSGIFLGWGLYLARFLIGLTRALLWLLMVLGELISNFMLRQMEYDADRHQVRMVGADQLAPTLLRVSRLEIASHFATQDLQESWRVGQLGDDLAALLVARLSKLTPETAQELEQELKQLRTGFFDTHPSIQDRTKSAEKEQSRGIFHLEIPASVLFQDFAALCKRHTIAQYQEVFEDKFHSDSLIPTTALLRQQEALEKEREAFHRAFQGMFLELAPPRLRLPRLPQQEPTSHPNEEPEPNALDDDSTEVNEHTQAGSDAQTDHSTDNDPTTQLGESYEATQGEDASPFSQLDPTSQQTEQLTQKREELEELGEDFLELAEQVQGHFILYQQLDQKMLDLETQKRLHQLQQNHTNPEFLAIQQRIEEIKYEHGHLEQQRDEQQEPLEEALRAGALRIEFALSLLREPAVVDRLSDAPAMLDESHKLLKCYRLLRKLAGPLAELRDQLALMVAFHSLIEQGHHILIEYDNLIADQVGLIEILEDLHHRLKDDPYPFFHARGQINLAEYAIEEIPSDPEQAGTNMVATEMALDRLLSLQNRILGRLSMFAERIEDTLDIATLPDPDMEALSPTPPFDMDDESEL